MRKKRTYTRRGRALCLAFWLTVLLLASGALGIVNLLPEQAMHRLWQTQGVSNAQIIHGTWRIGTRNDLERIFLSQKEHSIMINVVRWGFIGGWYPTSTSIVMPKDDPEKRHGSWISSEKDGYRICVVGFVPAGEKPPTVLVRFTDWSKDENGALQYLGEPVRFTPVADISSNGGRCFFEEMHIDAEQYGDATPRIAFLTDGEELQPGYLVRETKNIVASSWID